MAKRGKKPTAAEKKMAASTKKMAAKLAKALRDALQARHERISGRKLSKSDVSALKDAIKVIEVVSEKELADHLRDAKDALSIVVRGDGVTVVKPRR